jgi:FkbM family methyltransferase
MGFRLLSALGAFSQRFSRFQRPAQIEPGRILKSWVKRLNIDLVVDVGANEGQFVERMRDMAYGGQIVSFEPLHEAFDKLNAKFGSTSNWRGLQLALGERDEELTMEVAGNSMMSSSLLHMLPNHVEAYPASAIYKTETVKVRRLDETLRPKLNGANRLFLKIDTQGFEDHVLRGAQGILEYVALLELELSLVPLYESQSLLPEMMNFVADLGFLPVDLGRGFADDVRGRLLQVDGLFVRSDLINSLPAGT